MLTHSSTIASKFSRILYKMPAFSHLSEKAIGKIVNAMVYESIPSGTELCREGDVADRMFVIVSGTCSVSTSKATQLKCQAPLEKLKELDIVGESMMCEDEGGRVRIATVTADATAQEKMSLKQGKSDAAKSTWIKSGVQILTLSRADYEKLVLSDVIGSRTQSVVRSVSNARRSQNREKLVSVHALRSVQEARAGAGKQGGAVTGQSIANALVQGAKMD